MMNEKEKKINLNLTTKICMYNDDESLMIDDGLLLRQQKTALELA